MSGSDGEEGQCNRTRESIVPKMGDILAKEYGDEVCHDEWTGTKDDLEQEDSDQAITYAKVAARSPVVADSVPNANVALDESVINEFIKGARSPESTELNAMQTGHEIVENLGNTVSIDSLCRGKEMCSCDVCKVNRGIFREEVQRATKFQNLWTELHQHIRTSFNIALQARFSGGLKLKQNTFSEDDMHKLVLQLCKRDPHHLFMRLVSLAQEFVVEVKVRLLVLLHDHNVNNLPETFITGFLDDYDALISTALKISEFVKLLKDHFGKFNCKFPLSWGSFIKKLYQIYVFDDPLIQNNLQPFFSELRDSLSSKVSEYELLVHRYLSLDKEMSIIRDLWAETESWMDKYNAEQAIRMTRVRQVREGWELFTATRKLIEQRMLNKSPDSASEIQETNEQLSASVSPMKMGVSELDNRPLSPIPDFNLDSLNMLPSIEILKILLDDLTQFAMRTARTHNDGTCMENNVQEGKSCECHMCTGPAVTSTITKNDTENTLLPFDNAFPQIISDFLDTGYYSATQVRKKVEDVEIKELKSDENDVRNVNEDTDLRTSDPQPCSCLYQHVREITERKMVLENPPCPCLLSTRRKIRDNCPCLTKSETAVSNGHPKPVSPYPSNTKDNQESNKPIVKTGSTQSAQTQTRHSTTQTPNTTHNHTTSQGTTHSHPHGSPQEAKNTGSTHRSHAHSNHSSHACHKQANVEHIKRVPCNDLSSGDGDCSDSGSSQEDSCSTTSSAQRDLGRHCDCCYCEVFGHGVPSVAPVSRNYNEMRERLRQLLTKKKARKCKTTCSPSKSPSESVMSNTSTETKAATNSVPRSNTPVLNVPTIQTGQRDQRDLEELLEFIEGNQNGKKDNNKKAEKKARQKQRKLEEKLKRDRQEAQRQKLIEIQKKTPEVTITIVDPQKPISQRLLPQCNLPEVSILPTLPPAVSSSGKQISNKKKDKQEVYSNSSNISNCSSSISSINSKTKTAPVNTNLKNKSISKADKTMISSQATNNKTAIKNDKTEANNKNNKMQGASNNSTNVKNNTNNVTEKLLTVDSNDTKLTKKERKKLKKEMKKMEEAKAKEEAKKPVQTEPQPQIVTIKRVMESNSAEPTVTITLKGQTPAEDKVLFTLVNGQTKEVANLKLDNEQNQNISGKKKKSKAHNNNNNNANNNNTLQGNKQINNVKQVQNKISDNKNNMKQQSNNEKNKGKQTEEKKIQQQTVTETKTKSKKDKKNTENKENVLQNTVNKNKNQQQNAAGKKQNKINPPSQVQVTQKSSQNTNIVNNEKNKKSKTQTQDKNAQLSSNKNNKSVCNGVTIRQAKNDNNKVQNGKMTNQTAIKQRPEVRSMSTERISSPLSNQFKDISVNSKINIENLKLPPGITITKVDAPAKPLPIRSAPLSKPVAPPKQTTIIAAPMSGVQSSYASPQAGGNVIVVDTGKLKQDLLPKPSEKDVVPKETQQNQSGTGKKKKKKNKNASNSNNSSNQVQNQITIDPFMNDHTEESARILHNPNTNMVTIRNPAFDAMKVPPTQQAAIIKVSENGMVTIRSPVLQQAINAGLTSPAKPDYIVKNELSSQKSADNTNMKHTNGIIPSTLAELRSRLTPDCTALSGLANIQISKVTNGQPIPENGINLKGTSVTLTKVRTESNIEDVQNASITAATSSNGKNKKKKKRGTGTRQSGDDWNLVESVFTPKDIDLEDGDMDETERDIEAFKRFCLQSVPPPRKEKVNLNIKDIVLKKKSSSSSSSSTAAAVIAAN